MIGFREAGDRRPTRGTLDSAEPTLICWLVLRAVVG